MPNLFGLGAIGFWALLGPFTALAGPVPPFQLVALTFAIGGGLILAIATLSNRLARVRPTSASLALGIGGLLGDTVLYFAALQNAPPAAANLAHYLWPLLIVLFAGALPGGRIGRRALAGAGLGFAGTVLLIGPGPGTGVAPGLLFAFAGAVVWAGYSVLSRALAAIPSESLAATLLAAALLATFLHLGLETTRWPTRAAEWAGVVGLGLGPTGAAFLLWDVAMKRGNVAFLGAASYASPVLSTAILVAAGYGEARLALGAACALIVAGALLAAPRA